MTSDPYDLERFVAAQDARGTYASAVAELRAGRKLTHWMWFVFPQIAGLGMSEMSRRYAISSLEEARRYLAHPILGERLRECARALTELDGRTADDVFGPVDAMKLRSSMTLFARAAPEDPALRRGLDRYFNGVADDGDRGASARLEVDPHHDPADGRPADLAEARIGKDAAAADVELSQEPSLRGLVDHRVALDGAGAALAREVDCGACERTADSAAAEARAGDEAGHRPDAVVGLVLVSAFPGDTGLEQQPRVRRARLHRAPADRLAVEVGDEAARRLGIRVATLGLRAEPERQLLPADRGPRLPRLHLVALALAAGRIAARAEHGLDVVPARLVGGNDLDRCRVGHAGTVLDDAS